MLAALRARDDLSRVPMGHVAHAAVVRFDRLDDPHDHLERLARRHDIPRRMRRLAEAHGPIAYLPDDPRREQGTYRLEVGDDTLVFVVDLLGVR